MLTNAPILQIAIFMHDLPRARDYYRETLGLKLLSEADGTVLFSIGGLRLSMRQYDQLTPAPNAVLYFGVANIDESYRQLVDRGAHILSAPQKVADTGISELWMCEIADPEGNRLALLTQRRSL
jgi:predicted enzyme related to lactoylglutathione lyase